MDERYIPQTVDIPVQLYQSMLGRYFVGYADYLNFTGKNTSAWASLYNPPDSGVLLHLNVWTVTSLYSSFRAQILDECRDAGAAQCLIRT